MRGSLSKKLFFIFLAWGVLPFSIARAEFLTVAVGEWPPYVSELIIGYGMTSERVTETYQKVGLAVEFEFMPWRRAYDETVKGKYVMSFPWINSDERGLALKFPEKPIMRIKQVVIYKKNHFVSPLKVKSLQDLKQQNLLAVSVNGYNTTSELIKLGVRVHVVGRPDSAWKMLSMDRADIYIEDFEVAKLEVKRLFNQNFSDYYDVAGVIDTQNAFTVFSRFHPSTPDLMNLWERHADFDLAFKEIKS